MFQLGGVLGLALFGLWLFCLIDAITTEPGDARNLPKTAWLLIVLFFPLVGSIAWLVAGRPARAARLPRTHRRSAPASPEPGRSATRGESDAEFLRRVRERAEEQRRKARGTDDEPGTEQ